MTETDLRRGRLLSFVNSMGCERVPAAGVLHRLQAAGFGASKRVFLEDLAALEELGHVRTALIGGLTWIWLTATGDDVAALVGQDQAQQRSPAGCRVHLDLGGGAWMSLCPDTPLRPEAVDALREAARELVAAVLRDDAGLRGVSPPLPRATAHLGAREQ